VLEPDVRLSSFSKALIQDLGGNATTCNTVFTQFACDRLLSRHRKKMAYESVDLTCKTMNAFASFNESRKSVTLNLHDDIKTEARHFIRKTLENYTRSQDSRMIQEPLSLPHFFDLWKFGPGASFKIYGSHPVAKIRQKWTCTRRALPLISKIRSLSPSLQSFDARKGVVGLKTVRGSRLGTVRKNEETDRTIGTEPLGNMCGQLAAGIYLERALCFAGLDISTQQNYNKLLAYYGSVNGTLCTIDLKNASDCITTALVRTLFPTEWYFLLTGLRSPEIRIGKEWHELNMMSTMGNGFTFPMMTLILLALVYANARVFHNGKSYVDYLNIGVYGDDIICPTSQSDTLFTVLQSAGFIINHDKSYVSGSFRESCGGDYYSGVDVTPFYIKSLSDDSAIYVAINAVLDWSVRHNFALHNCLRLLLSYIARPYFVPEYENVDSGIRCTFGKRRYKYLKRIVRGFKTPYNDHFLAALAVEGFVVSTNDSCKYTGQTRGFFIPRDDKRWSSDDTISDRNRYYFTSGNRRIPKGNYDGRCGFSYSERASRMRDFLVKLHTE